MKRKMLGSSLVVAGVMLAAGCGSAATVPATRSSATPADVAASVTPKQQATASAKAILKSFVAPPGAHRLAKQPELPGGWGRYPTMGMNSTTRVDAVGYWRAAGPPKALLTWEKAHISRRYSRQDVIVGPPSWSTLYSLPAIRGVLPQREMNVQVYDAGSGMTVIKAEAMVSWQPPRPATEVIPATARAVTIAASGPWQGNPGPVTITSASVVRQLAALVNSLPVALAGERVPCPMGAGFTLTFRAAGGQPSAVARGPAECGVVHLVLKGQSEPDLQPSGSYRAAVLRIAGLDWHLG
jgi:hypothetical protein